MQKLRFPLTGALLALMIVALGLWMHEIWLAWSGLALVTLTVSWLGWLTWHLYLKASDLGEKMQQQSKRMLDFESRQNRHQESYQLLHDQLMEKDWLERQFFSNLAFELRTPLNFILSYSQLLMDENPVLANHEGFRDIRFTAESMNQRLALLLDFYEIRSGRFELRKTDFSILDFLDQKQNQYQALARTKELQWKVEVDADLGEWVHGSRRSLDLILNTLLDNAFRFTDEGSINMEVSALINATEKTGLEIAIRDTGIGIPEEKWEKMQAAFVQQTRPNEKAGMGLGLTLAYQLVDQIGGSLDFFSEPGKGTVVVLNLTLGKAAKRATEGDIARLIEDQEILVVEDNPLFRMVAKRVLTKWGANVTEAEDGMMALKAARARKFNLVLMDIRMPNMDGLEATAAIRKLPGWEEIPIIALTASTLDSSAQVLDQIGMQDILQKPIDLRLLREKLERHLSLHQIPHGD